MEDSATSAVPAYGMGWGAVVVAIVSESLDKKVTKLVLAHNAKLLDCDMAASAEVISSLSNVLGCVLATVLIKQPNNYAEAFRKIMERINDSAVTTATKAAHFAENSSDTLQ